MARPIAIGIQDFEEVREEGCFYIDKTSFIKEWWENKDRVTLITRPRRFGKTLTMSMVEKFFSVRYAERGDLFEGLSVWKEEKYRGLQGTYPVIFLSFASIKSQSYDLACYDIRSTLMEQFVNHNYLLQGDTLDGPEKEFFRKMAYDMPDRDMAQSLYNLSSYLYRYYGKKVIILLDEYDTPMQEAYTHGYWGELTELLRRLFNSTFKTNPYLGRAIMTGITRVSRESMFSDLNNLTVVTTTSKKYGTSFGFTEEEVFRSLDEYGLSDRKGEVKEWYDGFIFGDVMNIYNPWSIINFLDERRFGVYWANTSSNTLASDLIRRSVPEVKMAMEDLLNGGELITEIDEQIVFNQLDGSPSAIWSLLLASGYLKVVDIEADMLVDAIYHLKLTNMEVYRMFRNMFHGWFSKPGANYGKFLQAFLKSDLEEMNHYMNDIALATISYFDSGKKSSEKNEPEKFYHGFVLGLMVELRGKYDVLSNRESGFGRYDVLVEPLDKVGDVYILEFKVRDSGKEKTLEDTVESALGQIDRMEYDAGLLSKGFRQDQIVHYGFAFEGQKVLIGMYPERQKVRKKSWFGTEGMNVFR